MKSLMTVLNEGGPASLQPLSQTQVSKGKGLLLVGGLALNTLLVSTSAPVIRKDVVPIDLDWTSSGWSGATLASTISFISEESVRDPGSAMVEIAASTAEVVQQIRIRSGLTWEQLSKIFGVSRRSVHLWAAGGSMNAGHEVTLRHLESLISQLDGRSPAELRAILLSPDRSGRSIYDVLRGQKAAGSRVSGSPYSFDELLGMTDEEAAT